MFSFTWYPFGMEHNDMIHLAHNMIVETCSGPLLDRNAVFLFLLTVYKMHRPLPYHNFEHSFMSMHTVYCILKRYPERFDDMEVNVGIMHNMTDS